MSVAGHAPFYFNQIKSYVIYFGSLFNNIRITRNDADGVQDTLIKVAFDYSGRDKNLLRIDTDPSSPKAEDCPPGFFTFPRIGFELTGMSYNSDRQLSPMQRIVKKQDDDLDKVRRAYSPAPYDINFSLYIMSKNIEDANKIVEQILPFFTPKFTAQVHVVPGFIQHDIPIVLDSVNYEDRYQGDFLERRNVFWTLNFTMVGYFYGPIQDKPIVKFSNTDFFIGNTSTTNTSVMSVQVKPGQDANGDPTTNAAVTIDTSNIAIDSTFGYIETWTDATDANTSS